MMDDIPQPIEAASILARNLFESETVEWDAVEENDWITCGWKRPRLVQEIVEVGGSKVLYLAEPEADRQSVGEYRVITVDEWHERDRWVRFPKMRILWVAAG